MLKFSGHPLYDVGVATITVFSGKDVPSKVTIKDLDRIASFMEKRYVINPLKSFLTVAFTSNSAFSQPSYNKQPAKRLEYVRKLLRAYKHDKVDTEGEKCVFTGESAVAMSLSQETSAGRAFRQHIPLITGEKAINFFPGGIAGLPVSGKALLCIYAFPLGSAKCAGKLFAVHSDDPEIMIYFAGEFLKRNIENLSLAQASGSSKMPEYKMRHKTLLINELERKIGELKEDRPFSVTAYHLSNSGQSPSLDIYFLPIETTRFLKRVLAPAYKNYWDIMASRAWHKDQKSGDASGVNYLYEDIFNLPNNALFFLSTYFLRTAVKGAKKGDPRKGYSPLREVELVSFKVTSLFLEEVMDMEKEKINTIRELGDKLADYVYEINDRGFFRGFFTELRYDYFRTLLLKANLRWVKKGNEPLLTFEPYIAVFEEGANLPYSNWRLIRDLLLIRMIERLHEKGWLGSNKEIIEEIESETEGGE